MKRILLCLFAAAAFGCAKSSDAPEAKEKIGPAAIDPRAAKPMLEKARKAAAAENARSEQTLKELEGN